MKTFLTNTSPDAFLDHTKKTPEGEYTQLCQVCQGYGGWNLELNIYPLPPNVENTPENRMKYTHFRAVCYNCHGWGYIHKDETCQKHNWKFTKQLGNCYRQYTCTKCNKIQNIDSSD